MEIVWTALVKFLISHWLPVVGAALIGVAYVGGLYKEREKLIPEIKRLEAKDKERDREIARERNEWSAKIAAQQKQAKDFADDLGAKNRADLDAANTALAHALERVRKSEQTRPAALQPAASAPVACKQYEADPGLLPQRDRELFLRIGDSCNRVVLARNLCFAQYEMIRQRFVNYNADSTWMAEVF